MSAETLAGIVAILAFAGLYGLSLRDNQKRRDAERALAEQTLRLEAAQKAIVAGEETRKILTTLSDQIRITSEATKAVGVMEERVIGLVEWMKGTIDRVNAENSRLIEKAGDKEASYQLVIDALRQEVSFLRRAMFADQSFERARTDLEAERLVREADGQSEAIQADTAMAPFIGRQQHGYRGPVGSRPRTLTTRRRDASPPDDTDVREIGGAGEATVAGPVPSDEHLTLG